MVYLNNFSIIFSARAYRYCPANAMWNDAMSDYSECMSLLQEQSTEDPVTLFSQQIRFSIMLSYNLFCHMFYNVTNFDKNDINAPQPLYRT